MPAVAVALLAEVEEVHHPQVPAAAEEQLVEVEEAQ